MKNAVRLKSQAGFSLIELMIVVAIIGILATIAVPNFQRFQAKAKQSEGKGYLSAIYTGEKSFRAEWDNYTSCMEGIGFDRDSTTPRYSAGFTGAAYNPTTLATCTVSRLGGGTAPAALGAGGVVPTALVFTAVATGNIGGAVNDNWTIDQNRTIRNTVAGY